MRDKYKKYGTATLDASEGAEMATEATKAASTPGPGILKKTISGGGESLKKPKAGYEDDEEFVPKFDHRNL